MLKKIISFIASVVSVVVALLGVNIIVGGNSFLGIPVCVFGFICFSLVAAYNSDEEEK